MGQLTIAASGQALTVDIQTPGAHEAVTYSDAALSTPITLPLAITADQDFYFTAGTKVVDVTVTTTAAGVVLLSERIEIPNVGQVIRAPLPTEAQQAKTDATAASGALSLTKVAKVTAVTTPFTATHGTLASVDLTGGTIVKGAAYWGVAGSALDLNVTILTPAGNVVLPQDDRQYDIFAVANVTCSPLDAGKMVGIALDGNNQTTRSWAPVDADGGVSLVTQMTDQAFVGDVNPSISLTVDARLLTVDATVNFAWMDLFQR